MAETDKDPIDVALDGVKSKYHKVLKTAGTLAKVSREVDGDLLALKATYDAAVAEFAAVRKEASDAADAAADELARYTAEQEKKLGIALNLYPSSNSSQVTL